MTEKPNQQCNKGEQSQSQTANSRAQTAFML